MMVVKISTAKRAGGSAQKREIRITIEAMRAQTARNTREDSLTGCGWGPVILRSRIPQDLPWNKKGGSRRRSNHSPLFMDLATRMEQGSSFTIRAAMLPKSSEDKPIFAFLTHLPRHGSQPQMTRTFQVRENLRKQVVLFAGSLEQENQRWSCLVSFGSFGAS